MIKIKEGFKNERVVSVSEKLLEEYRKDPLVRNLYIRKIGYFPQARFHFIQKADGCDYAMLIYCIDGKGWYEINGQTYILRKNEFVILPSDTPYTFGASSRNPWSIYWHKPTVSSLRDMPRSLYNRETTPVYKTACGFLTRYSIISP